MSLKREICKTSDLSEHLHIKFMTLHTLQMSPEGCHCNIQYETPNLRDGYKEKIIWQLMTYINWEINMFLVSVSDFFFNQLFFKLFLYFSDTFFSDT